MVKILMSHKQIGQNELKDLAALYVHNMDGIADYAEFQTLITALKSLNETFDLALKNGTMGGKDRTNAKKKAKEDVETAVTKIVKLIEIKANDMPEAAGVAYVTGAGFEVPEPKSKNKKVITYLDKPVLTITQENGRSGVAVLKWPKLTGALTYALEELDANNVWQNGKYCSQTSIELVDLAVGVPKTYRIKGIGEGTLVSPYSEPVTIWIN